MRCEHCRAWWQDYTPMVGVEDWGCSLDPKAGSDCGREFKDGSYGCNRKADYINKKMDLIEAEREKAQEEEYKTYLELCGKK